MTFCGVNTDLFEGIPCISGLLSVSEMLQGKCPRIAGALLQYAVALIQNYLAQMGSSPEIDAALGPLSSAAKAAQAATASELERFGDALIAAADGETLVDFNKIGYMCYTAASLYGTLPNRVMQKLAKAEQVLGTDAAPPSHVNAHPSLNPSMSGPPVFTPPGEFAPPPVPETHHEEDEKQTVEFGRPLELMQLASKAFKAGVNDVAVTALMAAINELKMKR